jgi:hypothetical protein
MRPPRAPHASGLPTPDELRIAALQRKIPAPPAPIVVVGRQRPPRRFHPPQRVRRAVVAAMHAEAPPPRPRLWPWIIVATVLATAGISLGVLGLFPHLR